MRHAARFATLLGALASAALFARRWPLPRRPRSVAKVGSGHVHGTSLVLEREADRQPKPSTPRPRAIPTWGITGFELNYNSGSYVEGPEGTSSGFASTSRRARRQPAGAEPSARSAVRTNQQLPGRQRSRNDRTEGRTPNCLGARYAVAQQAPSTTSNRKPGCRCDFGIDVEGATPLVDTCICFSKVTSAGIRNRRPAARVPSGDYHEYFEINNVPTEAAKSSSRRQISLKVLKSKLIFNGHAGRQLPDAAERLLDARTTSYLELESYGPAKFRRTETTHAGRRRQAATTLPFEPTADGHAGNGAVRSARRRDDRSCTVPQYTNEPSKTNTADIKDAHVTLPEGLTLNPSAAHGLEACTARTDRDRHAATRSAARPARRSAPSRSKPTCRPARSPATSISASPNGRRRSPSPPYHDLSSPPRAPTTCRCASKAWSAPNPSTGQARSRRFANNPQLPFSELRLTLERRRTGAAGQPAVVRERAGRNQLFIAVHRRAARRSTPTLVHDHRMPDPAALRADPDHRRARTPPPAPTAPTRSTSPAPTASSTSRRSPRRCPRACSARSPRSRSAANRRPRPGPARRRSQIGVATVTAGAGAEPYPALRAGLPDRPLRRRSLRPLDPGVGRGRAVQPRHASRPARRSSVDPHTARVTVATTNLPTIVGGVPVRLKTLNVEVNRPSFIFNPTNCGALATESTLTSTFNATQSLSTPFQVGNCTALAVQTGVQGLDQREDLEKERREPAGQPHPARARGEHQIGLRLAAQAAALAPDDAAESLPRSDVRGEPGQLPPARLRSRLGASSRPRCCRAS